MKYLYLFLLGFLLLFNKVSFCQLIVTPAHPITNNLQSIVESLVGEEVIVTNITSNQPSFSDAYGTFTESSGSLGINRGLLMTSGSIYTAPGPNNAPGSGTSVFGGSDNDLASLTGGTTFDACVIEFDITTSSTQLSFNYVFASEEYLEYVGSAYNDVFGFFISGPGIIGKRNLALIPLTSTPVAINNVNSTTNSVFYRDNGDGYSGSTNNGTLLQYDGFTYRLKAVINVQPCNTYHLKLAISDVGDAAFDSGVFIEAGSLSGKSGLLLAGSLAPSLKEICSSQLPLVLTAGTEVLQNYTWLKDNVVVSTGTNTYNVTSSGWYKVLAYRDDFCYWTDSIEVRIDPDFTLTASIDDTICLGASVPISAQAVGAGPFSYNWSPATGLNITSISNPTATPNATTTYTVIVNSGLCVKSEAVTITVFQPINLSVASSVNGCINEGIQLSASGAEYYTWTPAVYLNNATIANPLATISTATTFTVYGYNDCFNDQATVDVFPYSKPTVQAYGDTSICYGGTAILNSDYNSLYQYSWSPATGLSDPNIHNPISTPPDDQLYILSVDHNGCFKYDTVQVLVGEEIEARIYLPIRIGEVNWKVKLRNFSIGATNYVWYVTGMDSIVEKEPTLSITEENYYTVVLKAIDDAGCFDYDTIILKAYKVFIPNLITPNGDGENDSFVITGLGDNFAIEIYNRWGDRVYVKTNYRNEWNGDGLTDGVYYFKITNPISEEEIKGWVQIMR